MAHMIWGLLVKLYSDTLSNWEIKLWLTVLLNWLIDCPRAYLQNDTSNFHQILSPLNSAHYDTSPQNVEILCIVTIDYCDVTPLRIPVSTSHTHTHTLAHLLMTSLWTFSQWSVSSSVRYRTKCICSLDIQRIKGSWRLHYINQLIYLSNSESTETELNPTFSPPAGTQISTVQWHHSDPTVR